MLAVSSQQRCHQKQASSQLARPSGPHTYMKTDLIFHLQEKIQVISAENNLKQLGRPTKNDCVCVFWCETASKHAEKRSMLSNMAYDNAPCDAYDPRSCLGGRSLPPGLALDLKLQPKKTCNFFQKGLQKSKPAEQMQNHCETSHTCR